MITIAGLLISPLLFLGFILYLKYRFPGTAFDLLIKAFVWGCLISIPVILADQAAHYLQIDGARSIRRMIAYSFVMVAFASEVSKFLPLRFSLARKTNFSGPDTGIHFSVALALGLATIFAIYHAYFSDKSGAEQVYFLSIGPMNAILGIIMGFFIGMGKLRNNLFIDSMTGLIATIFFHGIYRFTLLTKDVTLFWLFAIGAVFIAAILIYKSKQIIAESY
jgi:protease PrsW